MLLVLTALLVIIALALLCYRYQKHSSVSIGGHYFRKLWALLKFKYFPQSKVLTDTSDTEIGQDPPLFDIQHPPFKNDIENSLTPSVGIDEDDLLLVKDTSNEHNLHKDALGGVLVFYLKADLQHHYGGMEFFQYVTTHNLHYGQHDVFHYRAEGSDTVKFSMVNGLNPGTLEDYQQEHFRTPVLCFLLPLVEGHGNLVIFDTLLATIQSLREKFGGVIEDQHHCLIDKQKIERYRRQLSS